jgi:CheY-like chemotaxis protein
MEMKESRARVPIIALTAQATRESVMRAGMDDFLQKPAMLDDLSRMIKKWLPV